MRKSRHWIKHFQRCLTLRKFQVDRGRDHVGKTTGVVDIHCSDNRLLGEVLAQLRTFVKQFNNSFDLVAMVADAGRRLFRHDRPDQQEWFRVDGLQQAQAPLTLNEDGGVTVRKFQDPSDKGLGTNDMQVIKVNVIQVRVTLCNDAYRVTVAE